MRRITAVTGAAALEEVHRLEDRLDEISDVLDAPRARLVERSREVVGEAKRLRKEIEGAAASKASSAAKDLLSSVVDLAHMRVLVKRVDGLGANDLRRLLDGLKGEDGLVTVLGSVTNGKPFLIGRVSADLVGEGLSAAAIVKEAAAEIEGGGGGRPEMAQAGGKDASGMDRALEKALGALKTADGGMSGG